MNFKPTLWKSIVSVLVFLIIDSILASASKGFWAPQSYIELMLLSGYLTISGVFLVSIYVLWSLFQKKK